MSQGLVGAMHELVDEVARAVLAAGDDAAPALELHERLTAPPTIALSGRVSSGKSTLVNAIVGAQVAPTDAAECTLVATSYQFGAPERLEYVGFDGDRTRVAWDRRHTLPRPLVEIDHAQAFTTQAYLRDRYRVVDTPGLSSHGSLLEAATRRALVESTAMPPPDVVLFLVEGGHLRADEVEFLGAMAATRRNTIVVVSRADTCGDGVLGAVDPFDTAAAHARRIVADHAHQTRVALPVAGLMAQTSEAGISEADAKVVARLGDADPFELALQVEAGADPDLVRLDQKVGTYTLIHGREAARLGAVALSNWLYQRSGLEELHQGIATVWRETGALARCDAALGALTELGARSPARDATATAIERARYRPELHRLAELQALRALEQRSPDSEVRTELEGIVDTPDLWAQWGADPGRVGAAAEPRLRDAQRRRATAFTNIERNALTVLERSYHLATTGQR